MATSFWIDLPTISVSVSPSGTQDSNLVSVSGSAITLGQAAMAASLPVVIASNQTAIPISGSITATNPSVGVTGATIPADATYVGGLNGGNLVGVVVDSSGHPVVVGAGTAGSASGGVVSIQGVASMTAVKVDGSAVTQPVSAAALPLPSGASTAAKQPALGTAGSASADVLSVQGVASMTALKVDGSGSTQPISGTVAATQSGTWTVQPGNTANTTAWKVDGSAVTQPVSGTVAISGTVAATQSGTWNITNVSGTVSLPTGASTAANQSTGNTSLASIDTKTPALGQAVKASSSPVTIASDQGALGSVIYTDTSPNAVNITAADAVSATATGFNSQAFVTGNPTANSTASFAVSGMNTVRAQVTGTWVGTLVSEISLDAGTTWTMAGLHQNGTVFSASTFTANIEGAVNLAGATNFRIRCTAYTSGTAVVKIVESPAIGTMYVINPQSEIPRTTGGLSVSTILSAATTNLTAAKGSAGQVYHISATNINAAVRYLKFYNSTSATVGTTAIVYRMAIPGNTAGSGFTTTFPYGFAFSTGISYALTTGAADNDTGAVAASEIMVNVGYN